PIAARSSWLQILSDQPVDHAVDPRAVPVVRLSAYAFADEARALRVPLGPLVEAVDLELQPVKAELVDQVLLEEARRLVGEPPAAEVGMHRQGAEVRDPAPRVRDLEAHQAGRLAVGLDHEAAELLRLGLRALDLLEQPVAVARPHDRHERVDVLVRHQLEQEVDVARLGSPQGHVHGEGAATGSRRWRRTAPDPSATPPRISAIPASSSQVSGSPSSSTP